ncbi:far upstream element-binding protein 3 [Phlebotomus argentipes]|uniref:far upstream element-binding protein 3 n=1 Tax=Phlebotomus argentipes TaxID=94469 RepID=UPI002892AF9C|nr:far upstream element-binding protein 3 [Phlebotomus argentipes]
MSDFSSVAPPQSQQNFSQSSAFAAALQRAKQIAAKIHPGSTQGTKRSLEEGPDNMYLEPENKKFSAGGDFGNAQGPGMTPAAMQAAAQAAAVAARLSVANPNATINEEIKIPDKMVGLIIGRGGEQITRLQADSGCKIQMAADSGGSPERMCSLSGPREAVNRAREMIQKIVSQHGSGSIEVVSHTTLPSLGGANSSFGAGGDRPGGGGGSGGGYPAYQEMMIPGSKVGLVIGKGGETIKMLQEKTGAKMIVIQDGPGQELEKPLRISGDPQKVEHAKQLVYELIQEKEAFQNRGGFNHGGPGGGSNAGGMMNPGNNEQLEVFVPKVAVGVVIGKGGDMIKKIQGETGCKLQFVQGRGDSPGDRRCFIQGSKQQVEDAKRMIDELIENVMRRENGERGMSRNGGGGGNFGEYGKPMRDEVSFVVPASKCGIIIGRGGDTIKQINQQSGAHCEMDRKAQNNNNEKTFIIRGNPDQIEHARSIISEKIGLDISLIGGSSGGVGGQNYQGMQGSAANTGYPQQWGYTPQSWDQQQQQQQPQQPQVQINPSTGQPDYSQQWIEYYRSMGLHREADIIEQQQKAKQQAVQAQTLVAGAAAQNGAQVQAQSALASVQTQQMQQAAGGQPDYSAQWAEYYRSIGKIDEAEAIENQIKAAKAGMPSSTASSATLPGYNLPSGGANPGTQNIVAAAGGFAPNSTQYPQFYGGANPAQPTAYPQGYPAGPYTAYTGAAAAAVAAAARGGAGPGVPTPTPQPSSSAEGGKK